MSEHSSHDSSDSILDSYYAGIKRIPLLDAQGERELSRQIATGSEEARRKLIEANLRLVIKIARAYVTPDMPLIDLIQEGNVGLIKAAEKFDGARNVRFSTYASWWIKQTITRALVNSRRAIRLPHRKEELIRRIQRAYNILTQKLQREPLDAEVAAELGVSAEAVAELRAMASSVVSLESELDTESGGVIDIYEDWSYSPDTAMIAENLREETARMLTLLMEKERRILMYRFELAGERRTLKTIGDELGISPETVRQIEKRALRKLRDQAVREDFGFAAERAV
ncbi:MAG TPA: RNA polymerase sigma factor RpoD/SigA [Rectinemataceae bacterium]|nr:RNA polymerase sigma factor RpoD/SigA [Rectinemataceae bacterium]